MAENHDTERGATKRNGLEEYGHRIIITGMEDSGRGHVEEIFLKLNLWEEMGVNGNMCSFRRKRGRGVLWGRRVLRRNGSNFLGWRPEAYLTMMRLYC